MKRVLLFTVILLMAAAVFGQQKFALVIGNGNYTGISRLNNPVNDANDMEAALKGLGFTVVKVLNGNLEQMENAVLNLRRSLGGTRNTYGFFFYAGHGVQANGENYLIPVNADNIRSESQLRDRAVSLQFVLDSLSEAGNELNMIVLDACRDNPFSWARSGSRGLSVVARAPTGCIVMYATGANSTASDGTGGRNGLFTGYLLNNLKTPGLSVYEVFDKTMGNVINISNGTQHPELSVRYAGATNAYLGSRPQPAAQPPAVFETGAASVATGSLEISTVTAGTARISGGSVNQSVELAAWGSLPIKKINAGTYRVTMRYTDGKTEEKTVEVGRAQEAKLEFSYRPPQPAPTPAPTAQPAAPPQRPVSDNMVRINGGTFQMGSNKGYTDEKPVHTVTISSFYMGKYEVTQKEYQEIMGTNPSNFKGDNLPVEKVSWFDAVEHCNKLSQREGLTPAYTINGTNVTWNRNANGYRLPTEAEWEYACRAGTPTAYNTGAGISDSTGWYNANSGSTSHPVGQKPANRWGLHDMHGNVMEWCWDWYGSYSKGAQTDPWGASSGSNRVIRGGNWLDSAENVRSANRYDSYPSDRYSYIGFRLVRNGN
jgi:formylglycine-generating enzyme required for sulfatase activity